MAQDAHVLDLWQGSGPVEAAPVLLVRYTICKTAYTVAIMSNGVVLE